MVAVRIAAAALSLVTCAGCAGAAAPVEPAPIRLNLVNPVLDDARASDDRSHIHDLVMDRRTGSPTAVGHQFGSGDVVGSAGYLCGIGGIGPDGEETRGGPSSVFQHFGTYLGAKLSLPIR